MEMLSNVLLNSSFNRNEKAWYLSSFFKCISFLIRIFIAIMLGPSFQCEVPFSIINFFYQISLLFFRNELRNIVQTFDILHLFSYYKLINMVEFKVMLRLLFNSWNKTHELSTRIIDQQLRRNHIKKLEGNYRRFQSYIVRQYKPNEQIELGLMRYHHNEAQKQYLAILQANYPLASKGYKINPYPRRQQNFELNRTNKQKIDFSSFLDQKPAKKTK